MADAKNKIIKQKIIQHVINITKDEWPRIILSWGMQFFYKISYVIGWTALIAIFVTKFGILSLPFFFIIYAFARIIGTYLYSNILSIYSKEKVIIWTAIAGSGLLLFSLFLKQFNEELFIFSAIPVFSIFFSQLYILNNAFIEELFTPLESERTFPIIESAETVGGITGAGIMLFHSTIIPISSLINIASIFLLIIVPIVLYHRILIKKLPFIQFNKNNEKHTYKFNNLKKYQKYFKEIPFLKVLLIMIVSQWIFTNLLEFQFTKAVYNNIPAGIANPAAELTHGLSSLHMFIYSFALLMQIFIASKIIRSLGVIGSLLLHPVVSLLSLGAMLFKFGFPSAVLTKLNFEMTSIIHKSAYHTSYYAIDHTIRDQVREIIEGFSRPVGILIAMGLLLIMQIFIKGALLNTLITIMMFGVMGTMLIVLLKNENNYSNISVRNLLHSNDPALQLNAIEVLGQKGHKKSTKVLSRTLKDNNLDVKVKVKILETLGLLKEHESILDILDYINDSNSKIRAAALKALYKFDVIQKKNLKRPFSFYRINTLLKKQFEVEEDNDIKGLIIKILAKLNNKSIVTFILKLLQSDDVHIKANCIGACNYFDDINLIHYLLPYLSSEYPQIRANTIIALWKYPKHKKELHRLLKKMLYSEDSVERIFGYYVVGEAEIESEKALLKEKLEVDNKEERLEAALALSKLDSKSGIPVICESLIYADSDGRERIKHDIDILPSQIKAGIDKYNRQIVSTYINRLLTDSDEINLEALDKNTLLKLRNAYELVNEHQQVQNIDIILNTLEFNPNYNA